MGYLSKDEIKVALDAADIAYDADATRDELLALMPEDKTGGGKTVRMRLLRDFWPEEGRRVRKGELLDMDVESAMDGMERGFVERAK